MNKNYKRSLINRERDGAVSEAIGFLLIFSLVMIGIGLITLYGYPILLEQQSNANVKNMERDMIVLQNDMKSLVYKNSPYKETSLKVSGGALAVYNYSTSPSSLGIDVTDSGVVDGATLKQLNLTPNTFGQLRYESDAGESIITLENGAVLTRMKFQEGSAMLSEPRWFLDTVNNNQTLIITLINISSDNVMSRNGIGIVKMNLENTEFYSFSDPSDPDGMDITITYNPHSVYNYSKAWENYFVNSLKMQKSNSDYSLKDVHTLVIKRYDIRILSI